ncbi:thrombospondin type 3 repeat-containing protein [Myxococcota bacterium]|nr:thrombospondin type 3 repeat-containing protein [Myxococcota bacterium]
MSSPLLLLLFAACKGADDVSSDSAAPDDTGVEESEVTDDTDDSTTDDTSIDDSGEPFDSECEEATLTVPTTGVCGVSSAGSNGWVQLRGQVLAPQGVITRGSVLINSEGEIACVGCDCDDAEATVIDCPEGVISPGLINPHDHITYTEGDPLAPTSKRYDHRHDWRGSVSTPSNSQDQGESWGELRQLLGGTTSLVGSGSAEGFVRNLDVSDDNEGLSLPDVMNQTFPLGDSNESQKTNCAWDFKESELEVYGAGAYLPHVAEGINDRAREEFRCLSSSFDGAIDVTEPNTAHIHSIGLTTEDYTNMAWSGAQLIWSPRSNIALYGHTAQVALFHKLGGVIALGTDWTYTGSINMTRELACAAEYNERNLGGLFTDQEIWEMATVNGAIATGSEHLIGSLKPGLVADIAVFDARSYSDHAAVINAEATGARLVMRGGEALYGEEAVLQGLGVSCEALDVCGESMAICAQSEVGRTYESLASLMSSAYPAFFCDGWPDDEPTCLPARSGEFTGESSDGDLDGDGLINDVDNCPTVFNPPRTMDDGAQPDLDSDGVGDACDESPLPDDLDGDGTLNSLDVCPFDEDDQADSDGDGKGDVCDVCPDQANPDSVCPPPLTTVQDVQGGSVSAGESVTIEGLVVTGLASNGFMVQDPDAADPRLSGIYVFTSSAPTVQLHDLVVVSGEVEEYYDETEIVLSSVKVIGTATPIEPTPVTVAEAASEDYEGVLIVLTDGSVTNAAYNCAVDGSSCKDTGLWEVGGSTGVVLYDKLYTDSDWDAQIGTLPAAGVMGFRFERRRLMPRDAEDFGG